jgi:hypothetical protein
MKREGTFNRTISGIKKWAGHPCPSVVVAKTESPVLRSVLRFLCYLPVPVNETPDGGARQVLEEEIFRFALFMPLDVGEKVT